MIKQPFLPAFLLLTIGLVLTSARARSATYNVLVDGSGFSPATLPINVGDTVVWVNNDDNDDAHTATSDLSPTKQDYWNAYLFNYEDFYAKTFNNAGTFTYRDQLTGNTGSIVVSGTVNQPPEVAITNPAPNAVFAAPASFTIEASAQDLDGHGISTVEFYVDDTWLDLSYTEPYTATVTDLAAGDHTLTAIAVDGLGAQATHSITITVKPAEIILSDPRMTGGFFLFDAAGLGVGKPTVLQSSADLKQWNPVRTNLADSPSMTFTNAISPGHRCYRVIQLP